MSVTSRRRFLSMAAACVAVSAIAAAASARTGQAAESSAGPGRAPDPTGQLQETYKGCTIRITEPSPGGPIGHLPVETVLIDGQPLHVMRQPNGSFTSVVEHFRPVRSLREAARNAVDALQGAALVPINHHHGS